MREAFTYDDVALVPQFNNIPSRTEPSLETWLTKEIKCASIQASEDFQNEFYGGLKAKTVAEGIDFWGPVSGSVENLITQFLGGLRSGMTYGGARNIKELQRKAEFVRVTNSYIFESKLRPD